MVDAPRRGGGPETKATAGRRGWRRQRERIGGVPGAENPTLSAAYKYAKFVGPSLGLNLVVIKVGPYRP